MAGLTASAAGSPSAQRTGSETDRAAQTAATECTIKGLQRAAGAAGVGQTDGESLETDQRDADGRRPWEETPQNTRPVDLDEPTPSGRGTDALEGPGTLLDLNG
ncbi:MAG: hypothetical protein JW888_05725 [Pirellulales bacterium]|nr:hypothetical protein [Pirellulales bacterium]